MLSRTLRSTTPLAVIALLVVPVFASPVVAQVGIPGAQGNWTFDALPSFPRLSYNAVAWHPSGDYALIVGGAPSNSTTDPTNGFSVILRWNGSAMDTILADRGAPLFDVQFHPNGTYALIVGHTDTIYRYNETMVDNKTVPELRNLWKESPLAPGEVFLGRGLAFKPNGDYALVSGGYLMRYDDANGFLLVHSGENAIFKNIAFNPNGTFAFIDGSACERQPDGECKIVLGSVFKYSDHKPLCDAHNQSTPCMIWVHNYGRFSPKFADVNDIVFAPNGRTAWIIGYDAGHGSTAMWRWQGKWNDLDAEEPAYQYFAQFHKEGKWSAMEWQPNGYKALIGAWTENHLYETDGGVFNKIIDNEYCKGKWNTSCPNVQDLAWHPSGEYAIISATDGGIFQYAPDARPWLIVRTPKENTTITDDTRVVIDAYVKRPGAKIERVEGRVDDRHTVIGFNERGPRWVIGDVKLPNFEPGRHNLTVRAFDGREWTENVTIPFFVANTAIDALATPVFKKSRYSEPTGTYALDWAGNPNATNYEWQESSEPLFTSARTHYTTEAKIEVFNQVPGSFYYRVRAHGGRAPSDWSASAIVNVQRVAEADIPVTLASPQITSTETLSLTGQYRVDWKAVENATVYEVHVALDSFFSKDLKALSTRETTLLEQAKEDGNYFYRVRARSNTEKSDWSAPYHMTVGEAQRTPAVPTPTIPEPDVPKARTEGDPGQKVPGASALVVLAFVAVAAVVRRRFGD